MGEKNETSQGTAKETHVSQGGPKTGRTRATVTGGARNKETVRSASETRADAGVVRQNALSEEVMRGRTVAPDTSRTPVKLLKTYSPYNAGEVAGFPHEEAQRLIA